jgi:hypothetical protein
MLERDRLRHIATRQITADDLHGALEGGESVVGKWQYAILRDDRPTRWACGTYTTERGAIRAALRR